jgi:hypothetical protein
VKLEFARPGTFSYWIQGHFAGCVHPTEREEQIALAAWNAARLALLERMEKDGELPGQLNNQGTD